MPRRSPTWFFLAKVGAGKAGVLLITAGITGAVALPRCGPANVSRPILRTQRGSGLVAGPPANIPRLLQLQLCKCVQFRPGVRIQCFPRRGQHAGYPIHGVPGEKLREVEAGEFADGANRHLEGGRREGFQEHALDELALADHVRAGRGPAPCLLEDRNFPEGQRDPHPLEHRVRAPKDRTREHREPKFGCLGGAKEIILEPCPERLALVEFFVLGRAIREVECVIVGNSGNRVGAPGRVEAPDEMAAVEVVADVKVVADLFLPPQPRRRPFCPSPA